MDKRCPCCGLTKPYSEFYKNAAKLDKHSDQCRTCTRATVNKAYYADREASRASARERMRLSRARQKQRDTNHPVPA